MPDVSFLVLATNLTISPHLGKSFNIPFTLIAVKPVILKTTSNMSSETLRMIILRDTQGDECAVTLQDLDAVAQ